jgi:hypothetical protein
VRFKLPFFFSMAQPAGDEAADGPSFSFLDSFASAIADGLLKAATVYADIVGPESASGAASADGSVMPASSSEASAPVPQSAPIARETTYDLDGRKYVLQFVELPKAVYVSISSGDRPPVMPNLVCATAAASLSAATSAGAPASSQRSAAPATSAVLGSNPDAEEVAARLSRRLGRMAFVSLGLEQPLTVEAAIDLPVIEQRMAEELLAPSLRQPAVKLQATPTLFGIT